MARIVHNLYWADYWVPLSTRPKQSAKSPRIHDLRHTHASWLMCGMTAAEH
ncbi:hypothetical protein NMQ03_09495 [Arthrobacter sp. DNA4]|uniref:hypothetical protein n=1 Tax=Arthrobacter sp. DNA4 TaxID=2963432 RepID=UPI0020CD09DC|nr:hypothetical protein [Arthrobacter sp. DNA4]UTT71287.1 hypothetical protein NMQ03_09495 [Arthrobacter sp. DNA4]